MKTEIINSILTVINALNTIEVKGKQNLLNLGGCINILEQACQEINNIPEQTQNEEDE